MQLPVYNIFIVCNGYSKFLNISLKYWLETLYDKDCFKIIIIFSKKDIATKEIVKKYICKNVLPCIYPANDYHNKGKTLKYAMQKFNHSFSDYIITTDADIIFHQTALDIISENALKEDILLSSYREDITENHTGLLLEQAFEKKHNWPWTDLSRKITSPSPFMGWFCCFPKKIINKINFIEDHIGYDVIDWKIANQIAALIGKKIIYFEYPVLHMWHGAKGANWKGLPNLVQS